MDKKETIEKKKQQIRDFLKLAETLGFDEKEKEKRLDALLEDLSKIMKSEN